MCEPREVTEWLSGELDSPYDLDPQGFSEEILRRLDAERAIDRWCNRFSDFELEE